MRRLGLALLVFLGLCGAAAAQGCGSGNPNCVAPTPPVGDSSNRIATTAFVQNPIGPLTQITCNNNSGDVALLNAALAKGGEVRPAGVCQVGASGGSPVNFTVSNTWLHGYGAGSTIFRVPAGSTYPGTSCVIQAIGNPTLTDIRVSDFTFDGSDAGTSLTPPNGTMLCSQAVTGLSYDHIELTRMYGTFGMSVQGVTNFNISDNTITLTTPRTTQNQCILATAALQNSNGFISKNICVGSAIEYDGTNIVVVGNEVSGWKFGGGITTGPCSGCGIIDGHNSIIGNTLHDSGTAADSNLTFPLGIEDWGPFDTVVGNVTFRNGGVGINAGGNNSVYANNVGWDNGQGTAAAGMLVQFSAAAACNNCVISGNSFFNTNGAAGTQTYGIGFNQAVTGAIIASDNYAGPGNLGTIGPTNAGAFSTGVIANNMPFQAFNGSGTPVEILRYNTNNQTQIGGPLGAGGAVIMPQQLFIFGANGIASSNAFVCGAGSNCVAQLVSPTSGTGQGSGFEISLGASPANLSLFVGGLSGQTGGAFNSDPLFYTNDFITSGGLFHWIIQSISGSGDALQLGLTGLNLQSTLVYKWNGDTGFSRDSAGVIDAGNGTTGNKSATIQAAKFVAGTSTVIANITEQVFNTSANSTYTPNANLVYAIVECVAQGGGGGGAAASATGVSSGGGGGAGSYSRVRLTKAQIGASQAITNTAAANGGATGNNNGTSGNNTSLGTLCVANGGGGGGGAATTSDGTGGAGGAVGTGDFTNTGNAGGRGEGASITTVTLGAGVGGPGPWGGMAAAVQGAASAVNGNAGTGCGAGGGGGSVVGSASTAAGGAGAPGCVIVTEYNSQ